MRGIHPSLFQRANARKRQIDFHSEGKGKVAESSILYTLDIDVSLHGGIPPRRLPDLERSEEHTSFSISEG